MASFPAVSNAVYAAIKIQEACRQLHAFELRIGIHLGEVLFENNDVFGDAGGFCLYGAKQLGAEDHWRGGFSVRGFVPA